MRDLDLSASNRRALALACLLLACAGQLRAQDDGGPARGADVPTLDRVQALRPDEELDLYRFENPIVIEPNGFAEAYDPGPTPEQVALLHGGYINYGINLGLKKSWNGIKKATGMRAETQAAIARPPPLDDAQMRRAATLCAIGGMACGEAQ